MGEVIWIEILSRQREVLGRHRCQGPEIHIGRGYDNDVVLDDPYVAPRHLRIVRGPDAGLVAEDLGSVNGVFADQGSTRLERVVLDGDRPIRIGRTYLRIRSADHAVAAERVAESVARWWPLALTLWGVILGIELLSLWLKETEKPTLYRYALPLLVTAITPLAWTAVWSTLSRIFSGRARFAGTLRVALVGLLAYSLLDELVDYGVFALVWRALADYEFVAMWLIVAGVCFAHVRALGPARLKLKAAAVAALALIAIATHTVVRHESQLRRGERSLVGDLKPPLFRLAPLRSEAAFFAGVERLQARLERARTEEPPVGAHFDDHD